MTDIQAKVWAGYAKAGAKLGQTVSHYRATSVTNPTASPQLLGTLVAAFDDKPNYKFAVPSLYGKPDKYVLADGSLLLPGDYLIGNGVTVFIGAMPRLLPIIGIECNLTINVLRPASNSGVGAQPYGGDLVSAETPIMTGWPAWVDIGTKGEKGDTNLVGDVRMPWFRVLMPAFAGVQVEAGDVIDDSLGRRYKVSACELSDMGWRLTAMQAET